MTTKKTIAYHAVVDTALRLASDNKLILVDVDGVLLDWHSMFRQWMTESGYVEDTNSKCYSLAKKYGLDDDEARKLVLQFNRSAAVGFCKPERDAVEYVGKLAELGYRFLPITAMGGDEYSRLLRRENLDNVFGNVFVGHFFVDLNASKDHILEIFEGTNAWWVEDKLSNAEAGLKYGLRSILISHEHNSHCDNKDIVIVESWEELHRHITN